MPPPATCFVEASAFLCSLTVSSAVDIECSVSDITLVVCCCGHRLKAVILIFTGLNTGSIVGDSGLS